MRMSLYCCVWDYVFESPPKDRTMCGVLVCKPLVLINTSSFIFKMKEIISDLHMVTLPREKVSVQNVLLTGSSALLVNKCCSN